jgi:hypothetical protein
MAKKTLRQINAEILDLTDELIDAQDSAEENAIIEALDALALERDKKLDNIAYVRLQMKSDVKAIDAEIKRLQARKHATENAGRRLDGYVMEELKRAGIKRHKGKLANLTISKSPMCAIVTNMDDIPDCFKETRTETVVKKSDAIKYFRETQQAVSGLKFIQGEHIRIK